MPGFNSALKNMVAIAAGLVPNISLVHKFGRNSVVPNGSWALVNAVAANNWRIMTAATFNIKLGGSANDTAAGTGAREITLVGLDGDGAALTETLATNGASASLATAGLFCRVFDAFVSKVGTRDGSNLGDIIIESGGNEILHIEIGEGKSEFGGYTVPLGKDGYLLSLNINVATNKDANIRCFVYEDFTNETAPFKAQTQELFFDELQGTYEESRESPILVLPELTDIWFEAFGNGGTTSVNVDFELLVIDR